MSNSVLDLRNPNNRSGTSQTEVITVKVSASDVKDRSKAPEEKEIFSWIASEYIPKEHGPYWFLATGGVATLFVILGIVTKSYFFIAFAVLAFLVIVLYARRTPGEIYFSVLPKGVWAGKKFYEFSKFKSFWVFERDSERELSLETIKGLTPFVRLPLGEVGANKIKAVLAGFLSEAEHRELFSDQLLKILRL